MLGGRRAKLTHFSSIYSLRTRWYPSDDSEEDARARREGWIPLHPGRRSPQDDFQRSEGKSSRRPLTQPFHLVSLSSLCGRISLQRWSLRLPVPRDFPSSRLHRQRPLPSSPSFLPPSGELARRSLLAHPTSLHSSKLLHRLIRYRRPYQPTRIAFGSRLGGPAAR